MKRGRWNERCISHHNEDVLEFFADYFSNSYKKCLLICGAGFDPRSSEVVIYLSRIMKERLSAKLIKEERPEPDSKLIEKADKNLTRIQSNCSNIEVFEIEIFANDGAVVGGRKIIEKIQALDFSEFTDIVVDMSALSLGISYPTVLYIFQEVQSYEKQINLHLVMLSNPDMDSAILSQPNDEISNVHGFELERLFGDIDIALLWMPVLSEGKHVQLKTIHSKVNPHDTCPILPFPSEDPKKGDQIACSVFSSIRSIWGGHLDNEWGLDPKNFVYADERMPLDIYRTILRIADERNPVFETFGGSTVILSPMGSKIPTLGALMAALERSFPVVYIESLTYNVDWTKVGQLAPDKSRMAHIWLSGEAYLEAS